MNIQLICQTREFTIFFEYELWRINKYSLYKHRSPVLSVYSTTCLVSTLVSTHSWLVSSPHSVPSSCTLCQPVLIVRTFDKKYRFGVPRYLRIKQVGLYTPSRVIFFLWIFELRYMIAITIVTPPLLRYGTLHQWFLSSAV